MLDILIKVRLSNARRYRLWPAHIHLFTLPLGYLLTCRTFSSAFGFSSFRSSGPKGGPLAQIEVPMAVTFTLLINAKELPCITLAVSFVYLIAPQASQSVWSIRWLMIIMDFSGDKQQAQSERDRTHYACLDLFFSSNHWSTWDCCGLKNWDFHYLPLFQIISNIKFQSW